MQHLVGHDRPRRAAHAEPARRSRDLERLAADVDHRRHEVEGEPGGGDRIRTPERRAGWPRGPEEAPRPPNLGGHPTIKGEERQKKPTPPGGGGAATPPP